MLVSDVWSKDLSRYRDRPINDDYDTRVHFLNLCKKTFTENDLFITVRLMGIKDKHRWIASRISAIRSSMNNKHFLKNNQAGVLYTLAVVVNENPDHPHCHILMSNVDEFTHPLYDDFRKLVEHKFGYGKEDKDVVIKNIWSDRVCFYTLLEQGKCSIVNDAISLKVR